MKPQRSREPFPFPGAAAIRATPGGDKDPLAFRMHGDEISQQGAAIFDVCQRLPAPMQEGLPQFLE